jgi:crotonobetainyl-CoA:carnitine CoA-transferase CaiB-like acyl-CoA transferase
VVKAESISRPDGARRGPPAFFDLLHAGHESVAVDFADKEGRAALRRLVGRADVVIEASRPRALAQLGVDMDRIVSEGRCRVWISLTGYGRRGEAAQWVAFGDDAAVAGGLVARDPGRGPCFCADAIADPLAGLHAAAAALTALADGGRWVVDVALARAAAACADPLPAWSAGAGPADVAPPRARVPAGRAPILGADTDAVLAELGRP